MATRPACGYHLALGDVRHYPILIQRFAEKLNRTTASILALAEEVFSEERHALAVRKAQYQCKLL